MNSISLGDGDSLITSFFKMKWKMEMGLRKHSRTEIG